jgi:Zn-finger nucleic acid-binding protein
MCPSGHGTLMSGKLLGELKELRIPDELASGSANNNANKSLICPHCSAPMQPVNYNDTGIIIHSCTNCPYRWLDAGETEKIEDYKPNIHPQDLLFLVSLQEKTRALSNDGTATGANPNPDVPINSGALGVLASDDPGTLGWLAGAGMYSLITGMLKSKVVRIIAPLIMLGFIILGYLILKQLNTVFSSRF